MKKVVLSLCYYIAPKLQVWGEGVFIREGEYLVSFPGIFQVFRFTSLVHYINLQWAFLFVYIYIYSTKNFILQKIFLKFYSVCVSVNVPKQTPRTYFGIQIPPTMNTNKLKSQAQYILGYFYITVLVFSGLCLMFSGDVRVCTVSLIMIVVCAITLPLCKFRVNS